MTLELWKIEWLNSEYADAGWHPLGTIPPMPIVEAIEVVGKYMEAHELHHLNWRLVNEDTGEEIYAIL